MIGASDISPEELQLLQPPVQGLAWQPESQLLQEPHEDVSPQELQPELQLEQPPQPPEYEQQWRRCLPNADAESAITIHTVNSTARNINIRRMTGPPEETVSTLATCSTGPTRPKRIVHIRGQAAKCKSFLRESPDNAIFVISASRMDGSVTSSVSPNPRTLPMSPCLTRQAIRRHWPMVFAVGTLFAVATLEIRFARGAASAARTAPLRRGMGNQYYCVCPGGFLARRAIWAPLLSPLWTIEQRLMVALP